jgi:hypothetical protein
MPVDDKLGPPVVSELRGGAVAVVGDAPGVAWSVSQPAIRVKSWGRRQTAAGSSPVMVH